LDNPLSGTLSEQTNESYEAISWTWGTDEETSFIELDAHKRMFIKPNLERALKHLRRHHEKRVLWIDAICIDQSNPEERNAQVKMMSKIYSNAVNVCVWLGDKDKDGKSDKAINFITNKISDLGAFDEHINDKKYNEEWDALGRLMTRPWFSRRWIIQEIALATAATMHCGDQCVGWNEFALAVALFEKGSPTMSTKFKRSEAFGNDPEYFGAVQALGACRLVHATTNLFRRSDDRTRIVEHLLTLEDLVSTLSAFESKEPHDTFYAVLSLAKDVRARIKSDTPRSSSPVKQKAHSWPSGMDGSVDNSSDKERKRDSDEIEEPGGQRRKTAISTRFSEPDPNPDGGLPAHRTDSSLSQVSTTSDGMTDKQSKLAEMVVNQFKKATNPKNKQIFDIDYKQPFFEVCKQFLDFVLKKSGNLDMLLRPWAPQVDGLPSWIPTLDRTAFAPRRAKSAAGDYKMNRRNADPLVGQTGLRRKVYNASKRVARPDDWKFGDSREHTSSLSVRGFELDRIGRLEEVSQMGNVPEPWLKLGGWPARRTQNSSVEPPPDQFWLTLVAERSPHGLNPPPYYRDACLYAANHSVDGGGIDTKDLKNYGGSSITAEFLERVQAVIWRRRMFRTRRDGRLGEKLGLAPHTAEVGDSRFLQKLDAFTRKLTRLQVYVLFTAVLCPSSSAKFHLAISAGTKFLVDLQRGIISDHTEIQSIISSANVMSME